MLHRAESKTKQSEPFWESNFDSCFQGMCDVPATACSSARLALKELPVPGKTEELNVWSMTICPSFRPNCKRIINLAPSPPAPVSVPQVKEYSRNMFLIAAVYIFPFQMCSQVPGMCRVTCAHCHDSFLFNTLNNALARYNFDHYAFLTKPERVLLHREF